MSPRHDDDESGRSFLIPLVGIAVALLLGIGCVWFFFVRSRDAAVSGLVTFDQKAVPGAVIVFVSESEVAIPTQSDESGNYRLIGNTGAGIPPGSYKVTVTQDTLKDGSVPKDIKQLQRARADGLLENRLPSAYSDHRTTPLRFDIHSGNNMVNLEVKKNP
jgi:hypothetical protein